MPRNYETVKIADPRRSKKRAKLIEWEARETYRGTRDVPVVVRSEARQPKPRKKASKRPRAEKSNPLQGEAAPQLMDTDETFCAEELVIPTSEKRVRQHACPSSTNITVLTSSSPSTPTLKSLSPRLALTYAASSILRAFRQRLHARAASLRRLSGGAPTVFLHLYSAGSAAKSRTSCFLFTEFKNGWESTSCLRG